jgi:hypothetical protein
VDSKTFRAHFDGHQIQLDEPLELAPNTELLVTVLPARSEEEDWAQLSLESLEGAYGDDEPEYTTDLIREANPDYEGR